MITMGRGKHTHLFTQQQQTETNMKEIITNVSVEPKHYNSVPIMGESYSFEQQYSSNLQLVCSLFQETPVHSPLNLPLSQLETKDNNM